MLRGSVLLVIVIGLLFSSQMAKAEDGTTQELGVKTAADAWAIAQQYIGLTSMKNRSQTAISDATNLIEVEEDNTPFLHGQIEDGPIWEIKLGEAMQSSEFDAFESERKKVPNGLTVWIDATTGLFLKAFTKYGKDSPDLCPEPPADSAAMQMGRREIWIEFPSEIPVITLMDALYPTPTSHSMGAKELLIHLVMRSKQGAEPKPIWNILARGLPSGVTGREIHPCIDKRMRLMIDATTGEPISIFVNVPKFLKKDLEK